MLIALNIGLIRALGRQRALRVLLVHFVAGSAIAGLFWIVGSFWPTGLDFPPSDSTDYVILIVMVAAPLASIICFEMSFAYEKIRAGIFNGFFTLIGGLICALSGWVLADLMVKNTETLPFYGAFLGLGLAWALVSLIMEMGDPAIYGINQKDVHQFLGGEK